ncbi:hypothetical protein [Streptosporangium sp. NPDC003464]
MSVLLDIAGPERLASSADRLHAVIDIMAALLLVAGFRSDLLAP